MITNILLLFILVVLALGNWAALLRAGRTIYACFIIIVPAAMVWIAIEEASLRFVVGSISILIPLGVVTLIITLFHQVLLQLYVIRTIEDIGDGHVVFSRNLLSIFFLGVSFFIIAFKLNLIPMINSIITFSLILKFIVGCFCLSASYIALLKLTSASEKELLGIKAINKED